MPRRHHHWNRIVRRAVLGALIVFGSLCAPRAQEPADAIIARVNGEALLLSQLKEAALDQDVPLASLSMEELHGEGFRRAITQLVDETLLLQKAKADQIKVDETGVARTVEGMLTTLRRQLGSEERLHQFLREHGLDLESLRRMMTERERRGTLVAELVAKRVQVDAGVLEAFANERREKGLSLEEVNLAQILITCPRDEQQTPYGRERAARALEAARKAGGSPEQFAALARELTEDPAGRERGGAMGWIDPAVLQPVLRAEIDKLQPGQISTPVASDQGFHVMRLLGRRTTRDLCYAEQFAKERARLAGQLRQEASIQLYEPKDLGLAAPPEKKPAKASE